MPPSVISLESSCATIDKRYCIGVIRPHYINQENEQQQQRTQTTQEENFPSQFH